MTEGAAGGTIETADGIDALRRADARPSVGAYGAGDTFAAALTYYVAAGTCAAGGVRTRVPPRARPCSPGSTRSTINNRFHGLRNDGAGVR